MTLKVKSKSQLKVKPGKKVVELKTAKKEIKKVEILPKLKTEKHELYVEITPEKQFALCDGRIIKDLKQLAELLKNIDDDVFYHHVNEFKNDFATWINDVFKDENLAEEIGEIKDKIEMRAEIYKHLFDNLNVSSKKK